MATRTAVKTVSLDAPIKGKAKAVTVKRQRDYSFNPAATFGKQLDVIAHRFSLSSGTMQNAQPMSTGSLAMDLAYGGGIRPAWYTHYGAEQSCKTTGALTIMAAAIKAAIPINAFWDYEGSSSNSRMYIESIIRTAGVNMSFDHIFGVENADGGWAHEPVVRYYAESVGEAFFDWFSTLLRSLPDKRFIAGEWWYRYPDEKEFQQYKQYGDPTMAKKHGKGIYIPAPDGNLQGIVCLDSYPAMNPESNDEEDGDNSIAVQARMFAKNIMRVKGRMSTKRVALVGINQVRTNPMARFQNPETEPGGAALKYYSDARGRFNSRVSDYPLWGKIDKGFEFEHSIHFKGTKDKYRYVEMKTTKNKLSQPGRNVWLRVWVEDGDGKAHGFDPFFDTLFYLRETGQLIGKGRKTIKLKLDGLPETKVIDWYDLKRWVLGTKQQMTEISNKYGMPKPFGLRAFCLQQMKKGKGEELYVRFKQSGASVDDGE